MYNETLLLLFKLGNVIVSNAKCYFCQQDGATTSSDERILCVGATNRCCMYYTIQGLQNNKKLVKSLKILIPDSQA